MVVDLREALKDLARSLFDPYRPELHYMRGPGPKWHAKHDRAPLDSYDALTAFVPLRSDTTWHSCHCAVIGDGRSVYGRFFRGPVDGARQKSVGVYGDEAPRPCSCVLWPR
jgi:hypothetical protein